MGMEKSWGKGRQYLQEYKPLAPTQLLSALYAIPSEVQDIFLTCLLELVLTFSKWHFGCFTVLYP